MGEKKTLTNTVLITMGSMGTCVAGLLPYDNNMLYLPLPETSEYMVASDSINEDKTVIAAVKKRETPPGHVNI